MSSKEKTISLEEAKNAVESTSRRVALLHLSYAKTLIRNLGEKKGKKLILEAIKDYGIRIGEKTKSEVAAKGLEILPKNSSAAKSFALPVVGMHDRIERVDVQGEVRNRVYGCVLAKTWKEYGEEKIGRYYCYMDIARYMAYNPDYKLVHTATIPDGDVYCELVARATSERDKRNFKRRSTKWIEIEK